MVSPELAGFELSMVSPELLRNSEVNELSMVSPELETVPDVVEGWDDNGGSLWGAIW
jgi:hypothetical protein